MLAANQVDRRTFAKGVLVISFSVLLAYLVMTVALILFFAAIDAEGGLIIAPVFAYGCVVVLAAMTGGLVYRAKVPALHLKAVAVSLVGVSPTLIGGTIVLSAIFGSDPEGIMNYLALATACLAALSGAFVVLALHVRKSPLRRI